MASQYTKLLRVAEPESSGLGSYLGSSEQNETTHLTQLVQKKHSNLQKSLKSQKINSFILDSSFVYYTIWLNFFKENKTRRQGVKMEKKEDPSSFFSI